MSGEGRRERIQNGKGMVSMALVCGVWRRIGVRKEAKEENYGV